MDLFPAFLSGVLCAFFAIENTGNAGQRIILSRGYDMPGRSNELSVRNTPEARRRLFAQRGSCSTPIQAWSVSLLLARELWLERKRLYFTFSATLLYALRAMLGWMFDMGLDELYRRYEEAADSVRNGVSSMGLSLLPEAEYCANPVTAVLCPEGIDGHDILELCLKRYGVALAGGLGPLGGKIFRLGPTSEMQLLPEHIEAALTAIQKAVEELRK